MDQNIVTIVKMAIVCNLMTRFSEIPHQNSSWLFVENDKLILRLIWKFKEPRTAKTIFKKRGLTFPDFKIYYKSKIIKTV